MLRSYAAAKGDPVHIRQRDVQEHQVKLVPSQLPPSVFRGHDSGAVVSLRGEALRQRIQNKAVVVYEQELPGHRSLSFVSEQPLGEGSHTVNRAPFEISLETLILPP